MNVDVVQVQIGNWCTFVVCHFLNHTIARGMVVWFYVVKNITYVHSKSIKLFKLTLGVDSNVPLVGRNILVKNKL